MYWLQEPLRGPDLPTHFSYSALTQLEACPRRWWLIHGIYDGLMGVYPLPIYPSAMLGTIVHGTMEDFAVLLRSAGYPTPRSDGFYEVRRRFPVREIVLRRRADFLARLATNPRADVSLLSSRVTVDRCIDEFKLLMLNMQEDTMSSGETHLGVSGGLRSERLAKGSTAEAELEDDRSLFTPSSPSSVYEGEGPVDEVGSGALVEDQPQRRSLPCPALLPEVRLSVHDPSLFGIIDLVITRPEGDTLIEYKTGQPRREHEEQLKFYGLLWWRETGRISRDCRIIYANHGAVSLGELSLETLREADARLRDRILELRQLFRQSRPPARPSQAQCVGCPVRQLCDSYWQDAATSTLRWTHELDVNADLHAAPSEWRDLDIELSEDCMTGETLDVNIAASETVPVTSRRLLCRLPPEFVPAGRKRATRLRLLGVGLDSVGTSLQVRWSQQSEAFWATT